MTSPFAHERTEWTLAHDHASDTDLDPSDALGHDDAPNPTPPHVCWQDADPWCGVCGAAVREWLRGVAS